MSTSYYASISHLVILEILLSCAQWDRVLAFAVLLPCCLNCNIPSDLLMQHPLTVSLVSGRENSSLTDSLVKLIGDMNSEGPRRTANPGGLFSQICSKVPRFKGYQQQDSHELLRYLLDAMKNEELKV